MKKILKILISIISALLLMLLVFVIAAVKIATVVFMICAFVTFTFCVGFLIYEKLDELF